MQEKVEEHQSFVFPTRSSAIATQGAFKNLLAGTTSAFYNTNQTGMTKSPYRQKQMNEEQDKEV